MKYVEQTFLAVALWVAANAAFAAATDMADIKASESSGSATCQPGTGNHHASDEGEIPASAPNTAQPNNGGNGRTQVACHATTKLAVKNLPVGSVMTVAGDNTLTLTYP